MINWTKKGIHKLELIDSCSYGELWLCELLANVAEEIELFGGKLYWFFVNKLQRKLEKSMRGLEMRLNPRFNGVIDSAQSLRKYG